MWLVTLCLQEEAEFLVLYLGEQPSSSTCKTGRWGTRVRNTACRNDVACGRARASAFWGGGGFGDRR